MLLQKRGLKNRQENSNTPEPAKGASANSQNVSTLSGFRKSDQNQPGEKKCPPGPTTEWADDQQVGEPTITHWSNTLGNTPGRRKALGQTTSHGRKPRKGNRAADSYH